ncbi:MAG: metallophosphoesterase [FCB group bacterium]|nr:metallophosphoesterase [FCB group bacterium]
MQRLLIIINLLFLIGAASAYDWGDTLTIIQKPILNIPCIINPGDTFTAWLKSAASIDDWEGALLLEDLSFSLSKLGQNYNSDYGYWEVDFQAGGSIPYELYDFYVYSGSGSDTSRHAVSIIEEFSDNYNFIYIGDPHLPTHGFWTEPEPDTSKIPDLLAVFDDLAVINPAFLLIVGDLLDQGYMEEYQGRHYYARAQEVLQQCPVPFYLIAGNHDVGGCATPNNPFEQGCARRYWWKYFGWKWLENPPDGHYTQDFTFTYGNDLYIGMEAYENYDHWMQNIFGYYSFCPTALNWLNQQLANAGGYDNRILYSHWDYLNQLNPSALGLDMILLGHIHVNLGSLTQIPYWLVVESVCAHHKSVYGRAFQLIDVNDGELNPKPTQYAGGRGQNLTVEYFPNNNGQNSRVTAVIANNHDFDFPQAQLKFNVSQYGREYEVDYGEIKQVIEHDDHKTVYVEFNLPAGATTTINVFATSRNFNPSITSENSLRLEIYPNPFNDNTSIHLHLPKSQNIKLSIYDTTGRLIQELVYGYFACGDYIIPFNGEGLSSGIYFAILKAEAKTRVEKLLYIK